MARYIDQVVLEAAANAHRCSHADHCQRVAEERSGKTDEVGKTIRHASANGRPLHETVKHDVGMQTVKLYARTESTLLPQISQSYSRTSSRLLSKLRMVMRLARANPNMGHVAPSTAANTQPPKMCLGLRLGLGLDA